MSEIPNKLRVLITGAAGFVGSHLAERLKHDGHYVVGLDCLTDYYSPKIKSQTKQVLLDQGIEFVEQDLVDGLDIDWAAEFDFIFHLAAQPGNSPDVPLEQYVRNNITATHRLVEAVQHSGSLKLLVNVSTSSVYGTYAKGSEDTVPEPTSFYGVTKLAAEQLVLARARTKGLKACSIRLFSVYGERERPDKMYPILISSILNGQPFTLRQGSEKHLRSFTYVGDIVEGLARIIVHSEKCLGEIINLGCDLQISVAAAIAEVEKALGKKAQLKIVEARPGDQADTHANITKARALLGYEPRVYPEEGIARQVTWFVSNHRKTESGKMAT